MKVGIGVPTVGRRAISAGYLRHATRPTLMQVQLDNDRRGPGWARNQCIAKLYDAGCDLIVLMDDDCYPIRSGWQDYLAAGVAEYGVHVVTLENTHHLERQRVVNGELLVTTSTVGCFTALTRHAVDVIGYYSAAFSGYGFEDVHFQRRVARSGINGTNWQVSLVHLSDYIRSEDLVKPDIPTEYANMTRAEKDTSIARNLPIFNREISDPRNYRNREGL